MQQKVKSAALYFSLIKFITPTQQSNEEKMKKLLHFEQSFASNLAKQQWLRQNDS